MGVCLHNTAASSSGGVLMREVVLNRRCCVVENENVEVEVQLVENT